MICKIDDYIVNDSFVCYIFLAVNFGNNNILINFDKQIIINYIVHVSAQVITW